MTALLALLVTASFGSYAVAAPQRSQSDIRIVPVAILDDGGATMTVSMIVRCQPTGYMVEGFASVAQGDIALLTDFAVVCDGRPHLTRSEFSASADVTFHRGRADVFAIVFDEHTGTSIVEDARTVRVTG